MTEQVAPARETPAAVWADMRAGNARFVAGEPHHPNQDVERRHVLAAAQTPRAALFGCADSRLAAEIIFDQGLGDLFVVRNAGQVASDSAVASLEYAVAALDVPLIIVLAHDACGAVRAAIDSTTLESPELPSGIWQLIAKIVPAARTVLRENDGVDPRELDAEDVGIAHLRNTIDDILASSRLIADAVAAGRLGIVGANYRLSEGTAVPHVTVGIAD
ncbi:MAG: carbonic anhydrase [Microbacterium sp.]|uniref:carbonic anhydrase n=1 Tax=Microbacterium sp. TaxID=51671 RepID=UPI001AC40ED1|nr:carbonic anhydrase [Microbacterium sp.]MBN9175930.1 carbonic anhydrase [Microbacterium sp.]